VPADEATWLMLEPAAEKGTTWLLLDATGRVVREGRCTGPTTRISTGDLPAGPYSIVVRTGNGLRSSRLVVAH
jgi:hypothetical protein